MARVGVDIVEIARIEKLLDRPRFLQKVFSKKEIAYLEEKGLKAQTVAGSFAAKEAVSKLIGTGIGKLSFQDMEVLREDSGRPYLVLSEKGRTLADERGIAAIDISISHEKAYAIAVATGREEMDHNGLDTYKEKFLKSKLPKLKERPADSHKGNYGRLALVGGSKGMAGSISMSSLAALRTGTGLAYTLVPSCISDIVQIKLLENIVYSFGPTEKTSFDPASQDEILDRLKEMDAIAFGPGIGRSEGVQDLLEGVINLGKPTIVDADGLFALAKNPDIIRGKKLVLSPHLKEMERISGTKADQIKARQKEFAIEFAKEYSTTLVLKGHNTVVSDGKRVYINETGNSGMATAGSGDVLTGIIGSLLGQGYPTFEAASLGVFIHGLAGDIGASKIGEDSLIARDIIDNISQAIKVVRRCN